MSGRAAAVTHTHIGGARLTTACCCSIELSEMFVEAAKQGDARKVEELLLQGVDVNYQEKVCAARVADARCSHADDGARTRCGEQKGAYTALIKACRMQRMEVIRILLANGAAVNKASNNGWTAFIEAWCAGRPSARARAPLRRLRLSGGTCLTVPPAAASAIWNSPSCCWR